MESGVLKALAEANDRRLAKEEGCLKISEGSTFDRHLRAVVRYRERKLMYEQLISHIESQSIWAPERACADEGGK